MIILVSCSLSFGPQKDPFYTDVGTLDSARFPLIKPYYVIYIDKEYSWQMPLLANPPSKDIYYYYNLHDIRKIAVENGIIMIYTPFTEDVDQSIGQKVLHWFIIIPDKNVETGLDTEQAFLDYIKQLGVQQPPWVEPSEIYQQFFKTGCLDWIPDCK
ncbi:MAG: hypothetical protein HYR70_04410 [Chloroflexi bacterium]|nr:hypothetical protein [Chloroflexota bacterium]MBI3340799.1 hypothetical protein [Chloroflexota bacterium]